MGTLNRTLRRRTSHTRLAVIGECVRSEFEKRNVVNIKIKIINVQAFARTGSQNCINLKNVLNNLLLL